MRRRFRVDLVVPVKPLPVAKTRLRGAADGGVGALTAHTRLALALAMDTVAAARAARRVGSIVVISSDPAVAMEMAAIRCGTWGTDVVADPSKGLNGALRHGARLLREREPGGAVAALQADLPALRPDQLDGALDAALELFGSGATRAFCADEPGLGTTLLVAAPGTALDPHFGLGSAAAHVVSGAEPLDGDWPGLRRDVDTSADLARAAELGVGPRTRAVLTPPEDGPANLAEPVRNEPPHREERMRNEPPRCPNV
ncbi:2-phospho-L-lactate guanylyltransferase [Pseudonocardia sp. KRD291]|uniref:2-phospho-L-lactate guanylyltransferase n=1 Tax=Pseudonocardia sp. KRD291 TaxID=2792007 RepID=UPI0027E273A2|nr:2-phospho-L-lactate guanylyltransferase [Pseudonocardia sp. KRD291]